MSTSRSIRQILRSKPTIEGAGVHLKRVFGYQQTPSLDPFLLLDDFHSSNPDEYLKGFPWHPHRGIETITYVLQGEVAHGDSLGHQGMIGPGDVQWMTAGNGIIHQEMPHGDKIGRLWGFQLWANLPAAHKMMAPRYREIKQEQIPEVEVGDGVRVKVICGEVQGIKGPVEDIVIEPEYLDVSVEAGGQFSHSIPLGHKAFAYVIEGQGQFGVDASGESQRIGAEHLVLYGDGEEIALQATETGVRFLLISGKPIGEPVAWYGPIVMNTQAELETAFDELQKGTFLKHAVG